MMHQGVLPIQCEVDDSRSATTGRAGLLAYLELLVRLGVTSVAEEVRGADKGDQGWLDSQMALAFTLINLAGGNCLSDVDHLEADGGLCSLVRLYEWQGMSGKLRKKLAARFRQGRSRTFPSAAALSRWLAGHHEEQWKAERQGALEDGVKAFIPRTNRGLRELSRLQTLVASYLQGLNRQTCATLDGDATLVPSEKQDAYFCYKNFRAYQPLNMYWAEMGLVLHSEFRDGNVPAGYEKLRVFKETLEKLPVGVEKVRLRTDSAGYAWDLIKYCGEGKNRRFGVIEFAISADVTEPLREAARKHMNWQKLRTPDGRGGWVETGREWAEVAWEPNQAANKKYGPRYRFLATRELLLQLELPGTETAQAELPFPTMRANDGGTYKLHVVVTNVLGQGDEIIRWHQERCGKSEEAHSIMKSDLAGGQLPSKLFGANAAWWQLMIFALNVQTLMKRLVLGKDWLNRRMKAVRFGFINFVGKVVVHARSTVLKLFGSAEATRTIIEARARILALPCGPSG